MKTIILPVFAFMIIALPGICQTDPEGFVLVKSDAPFEVHERWVEFPDKKPAIISRELKSEFIVHATIYEILAFLKDESQVKSWQTNVNMYKIYQKQDTTYWEEYSRHDVPWPVSDQDSFLEYKLTDLKPGQELLITFKSRVDNMVAPEYEDITRIELIGSWRLEQISPGATRVTYRIQSAPRTHLPRMIVDPFIRNNLLSSVRSMTELIEK